jgi:hypothetical protein
MVKHSMNRATSTWTNVMVKHRMNRATSTWTNVMVKHRMNRATSTSTDVMGENHMMYIVVFTWFKNYFFECFIITFVFTKLRSNQLIQPKWDIHLIDLKSRNVIFKVKKRRFINSFVILMMKLICINYGKNIYWLLCVHYYQMSLWTGNVVRMSTLKRNESYMDCYGFL